MNNKFFYIFSSLALFCCVHVRAQETGGRIENREIVIEKNRKIELPPAARSFDKPSPVPPVNEPEVLYYNIKDVKTDLPPAETSVKALVLKQEPAPALLNNHLRLGFGNYVTPYLEGFVNNGKSKDMSWDARVRHFSSVNGPVRYSGFSQNMLNVGAAKYSDKFETGGRINLERNRYNFYGYDESLFPERSKSDLKQVFTDIGATFYLNNGDKKAMVDHKSSVEVGRTADRYDAAENRFIYNGKYTYGLDSLVGVVADVALHYYGYSQDSLSQGRALFSLNPKYVSERGDLRYSLGATVAFENDTLGDKSNVHLYPDLKAEYDPAENITLMAALDGGMDPVSYRSLTNVMPFWDRYLPVFHTNRKLGISGAVKITPLRKTMLLTGLSFTSFENFNFIVNNPGDQSKFNLLYDTKTITRLTYSLAAGYYFKEEASLKFDFKYHNYTVNTARPWHLPGVEANASFRHNLYEKIYFTADIYYIGSLYAYDFIQEKEVKLDDIADLNLKIDYKFNQKLSAFLGGYNLLGTKYERFYKYKSKSVNLLAGFTYSF